MRPFEFVAASTVDEAVRAGSIAGTRFVAGGTTLIDLMKLDVETPGRVVDINPLARRDHSLAAVAELPGGGLRLGALARMSDVAWDARVRDRYPVLSQALLQGASGQLRNMATIGGNILQRTRCPYFRDTAMPCNKREPGSGCSAIVGINRTEAVLGTSDQCIATHPSDLAVALAALDATVHVEGPGGARAIPLVGFHRLPGDEPERDTLLAPDELIVAVSVPPLGIPPPYTTYRKVRERASFAFALVSIAAAVDADGGSVREVRIALGGVAHRPWRATKAEDALRGAPATVESIVAAAAAELAEAVPLRDNAYKVELARNLIVDTVEELVGR
jgi:xanthine dehydrogenase YagS FAD-binding subunit